MILSTITQTVNDATQGTLGSLDVTAWSTLASALIPVVAAFADKTKTRAAVAIVASILVAALHVAAAGDVSFQGMVVAAFEALIVELGAYHAFWKPIVDINDKTPGGTKTGSTA